MNNYHSICGLNWSRAPATCEGTVELLRLESHLHLPEEYLAFLRFSNGGEGELGVGPGWFSLWSAQDVLHNNQNYEIPQWLPEYFGFGSNGAGELFVFRVQEQRPWEIYMIPFGNLEDNEAILVSESFNEFVRAIGHALSE